MGSVQLLKAVVPPGVSGPATFTATVFCDDGTLVTVTLPGTGGPGVPIVTARAGALCIIEENAASIPPGWTVLYVVGGVATSTPPIVTIAFNQTIAVTITNFAPGSITIVKDSVPDGPTPFSFTASAPLTPASFTLDDDGSPTPFPNTQTFTNVPGGGLYTITETPAAGFTLTAPVSCTGTSTITPITNGITILLAPGDNVVCTFVNTQQGSITIVKDSVPDSPTPFSFSVSPATVTPSTFTLDDDGTPTPFANSQVLGGIVTGTTYTVTETPAAGFTLTAINCVGGQTVTDVANNQVAITFTAGDNVVCTFVNTQQGSITIVKDSVPDGPTPFSFTASPPLTPTSFTLDDDGSPTPFPNSQTFRTSRPAAPTPSPKPQPRGSRSPPSTVSAARRSPNVPNGQVAITFTAGDNVVCTFVNIQQGSITIVKNSVPDGPTPFSFTASAPLTPASFTLDDDGSPTPFSNTQTFTNVPAGGPYTITETPAAGFTLTAPVSCTGTSTVTPTTNGVTITLVPRRQRRLHVRQRGSVSVCRRL